MPFYSIADGFDTTLFLMNNISDPISIDLAVRSDQGKRMALGQFVIESLNHLEISLSRRLAGFEEEFGRGSVRCELLGDADTLQGWAVISDPRGQRTELPFSTFEEFESSRLLGFWGAPGLGAEGKTEIYLLNATDRSLSARIVGRRPDDAAASPIELAPRERVKLDTGAGKKQHGGQAQVLRVEHDGPPGGVRAVGLLTGGATVRTWEFVDPAVAPASVRYESIPVPGFEASDRSRETPSPGKSWVTVFNDGDVAQFATVETLDGERGNVLAETRTRVEPGQVRTVVAASEGATGHVDSPLRFRVRGERDSLRVRGGTRSPWGGFKELEFFAHEDAHGRGTYPLPDVGRYDTVTTLVNLGDDDALVGVQVHWDGGTYAYGPLTVPSNGVYRIDLEKVAESAGVDVLGRELDRVRPHGVIKWTVMKGSTDLIGRTEVRSRETEGRFGFNCFGCCWEDAFATIEPNLVEFLPGESRAFQACLTYNDCSGTMGPYPVTPETMTVPEPFSWDGSTITASSAADATIEFGVDFLKTTVTCTSFLKELFGFGRAEICERLFNPNGYEPQGTSEQTCSQQTDYCIECIACCENIYQMLLCQGKRVDTITSNRMQCLQICRLDYDNAC